MTALKVEKKEGEKINYNKMKVKDLKKLLGKLTIQTTVYIYIHLFI